MDQTAELKNQSTGGGNPDLEALKAEAAAAGDPGKPEEVKTSVPEAATSPIAIAMFWKMIFGTVAGRGGDHWVLTEQEAMQLGQLSVPVVDKWLPAIMSKYGAEIALAGCVVIMVVDRIGKGNAKKAGDLNNSGAAGVGQNNAPAGAAA